MSWWSVLDELGWALVFLFGPGLAVGAALGLRRVWLLAVAPAASVAVRGAGGRPGPHRHPRPGWRGRGDWC